LHTLTPSRFACCRTQVFSSRVGPDEAPQPEEAAMSRYSTVICAAVCCVTSALIVAPTAAQSSGAGSKVTFGTTVQLPGVLVPAGAYQFRGKAGDKFVTVIDEASHVVATLAVVETTRAASGAVVTLRRSGASTPAEVTAWYPTGGTSGFEFIYSRQATPHAAGQSAEKK
jgi:hypothetical protein